MSDPFGPHHGMRQKEYNAMVARNGKQAWTERDEARLREKVKRLDPACEYCEEGLPLQGRWHIRVDPEGVEGTQRIPCQTR